MVRRFLIIERGALANHSPIILPRQTVAPFATHNASDITVATPRMPFSAIIDRHPCEQPSNYAIRQVSDWMRLEGYVARSPMKIGTLNAVFLAPGYRTAIG